MDCATALEILESVRPDSQDAADVDFSQATAHLSHCAACQAAFAARQNFDRKLGAIVRDVPIPTDLQSRLMAALSATSSSQPVREASQTPAPVAANAAVVPVGRTTRKWLQIAVTAALALLLVAGLSWQIWEAGKPQVTVAQVLKLTTDPDFRKQSLPDFNDAFVPMLPGKKENMRLPAALRSMHPLGLTVEGRQIAAVYRFSVSPHAGSVLEAVLVVLDLRRAKVSDPPADGTTFASVPVQYQNGRAAKVWRRGNQVYVCFVLTSGPEALELLREPVIST